MKGYQSNSPIMKDTSCDGSNGCVVKGLGEVERKRKSRSNKSSKAVNKDTGSNDCADIQCNLVSIDSNCRSILGNISCIASANKRIMASIVLHPSFRVSYWNF